MDAQPKQLDLVKAAQSAEFHIYRELEKMNSAFMTLFNQPTLEKAQACLKLLHLTGADLERYMREILIRWDIHPSLIRNVSKYTKDELNNRYLNLTQFYLRFLHAPSHEAKARNLTALYYLIKDVSELAEVTDAHAYAREVIIPCSEQ